MKYKEDFIEAADRFKGWWKREKTGQPLMFITAIREKPPEYLDDTDQSCGDFEIDKIISDYKKFFL